MGSDYDYWEAFGDETLAALDRAEEDDTHKSSAQFDPCSEKDATKTTIPRTSGDDDQARGKSSRSLSPAAESDDYDRFCDDFTEAELALLEEDSTRKCDAATSADIPTSSTAPQGHKPADIGSYGSDAGRQNTTLFTSDVDDSPHVSPNPERRSTPKRVDPVGPSETARSRSARGFSLPPAAQETDEDTSLNQLERPPSRVVRSPSATPESPFNPGRRPIRIQTYEHRGDLSPPSTPHGSPRKRLHKRSGATLQEDRPSKRRKECAAVPDTEAPRDYLDDEAIHSGEEETSGSEEELDGASTGHTPLDDDDILDDAEEEIESDEHDHITPTRKRKRVYDQRSMYRQSLAEVGADDTGLHFAGSLVHRGSNRFFPRGQGDSSQRYPRDSDEENGLSFGEEEDEYEIGSFVEASSTSEHDGSSSPSSASL